MTTDNLQPTQPPPPPLNTWQPNYPSTQPTRRNGGRALTVVGVLLSLVLLGAVVAGSYLFGANSRDDEVTNAEDATAAVETALEDTESELALAEVDLTSLQDDFDDLQAEIAACDIQGARRVFNDMLAGNSEWLAQYSEYLDSDDFFFYFDFDAYERATRGWAYNGRNTYPKQFNQALATCGSPSMEGTV